MKVSLTMIVKDEIDNLPGCLDSIQDLVDEIVIVDTGSTDGTLELVKERADVWDQVEWTGFADARNRSIELASGDVCVVLDADERIIDAEGWDEALRVLQDGADAVAFLLLNELPAQQILQADKMWQVRMWWNRPEARWRGKVHNQLTMALKAHPRDGKEAKFAQAKVQIQHKGYNMKPEELRKKYQGRLDGLLWEEENAENKQIKAYYQYQISNAYYMMGRKKESLEFAEKCDLEQLTEENKYALAMIATSACGDLRRAEEGLRWAKVLLETWPGEAMSFLMMGLSYLNVGRIQAAYNFLGSVLTMCQLNGMNYKYVLDAYYIAGATGEAALALGRYGEAKELFRMFLTKYEDPRVKALEAAIIPIEEARAQGLVDENGKEILEGKIPDSRTPEVSPLS